MLVEVPMIYATEYAAVCAERDTAIARAERAEAALEEARAIPALRVDGHITVGALADKFNEYRLNGAADERARGVEEVAALRDAMNLDNLDHTGGAARNLSTAYKAAVAKLEALP